MYFTINLCRFSGKYYVYELWRQDKNEPFYIGKGKNNRIFEHVQEAYHKLMNRTKWNDYFVTITLRNLFIDHIRKQKNVRLEELHYIIDHTNNFEPDDKQKELLDEFDKLDWVAKELLLERSTGRSLREIEKIHNINYGFTFRETTKAKKQINRKSSFLIMIPVPSWRLR